MAAQGVFALDPRVVFVEKTASEVGDGTVYPMKVTLDELAEIMFRVKDAWFTEGTMMVDFGGGPTEWIGIYGAPIETQLVNEENAGDNFNYRAYHTTGDIPENFDAWFKDAYTVRSKTYRDAKDSEFAIWAPYAVGFGPLFNGEGMTDIEDNFKCGFTHHLDFTGSSTETPGSFYGIYNPYSIDTIYEAADATVRISGTVAWVDNSGSGKPLDSNNDLYLEIEFTGTIQSSLFSTDKTYDDDFAPMLNAGVNLAFGLAQSTPKCPVYISDSLWTHPTGTDFLLQSKEWWPYQDADGNIWNPTTGAKL